MSIQVYTLYSTIDFLNGFNDLHCVVNVENNWNPSVPP